MRKLAADSAVVTILNVVSQIASFILFAGIAALFGANWQTDAFFLALTIPALFIGPVTNAIAAVYIPMLTECRIKRPEAFGKLIGATLLWLCVASVAVGLLVAWATPIVSGRMGGGLTVDSKRLAVQQTLLLLPMIALQIVISVLVAAYNSVGRFWLPSAAIALRYLSTFILIVVLKPLFGIVSLPVSYVLGSLLHLILVVAFWRRLGLHLVLTWRIEPDLVRSFRITLPVILGMAALQLIVTVSRLLAAQLPTGSISVLDYANRTSQGIMELLTSGVMLVTLADWSQVVAQGDASRLRSRLRQTILMVLFVILPLVSVLLALRESLIAIALQRGQFDAALTARTSGVLIFFLLGIPLDVILRTYLRLFLVWQETWTFGVLAVLRLVMLGACGLVLMNAIGVQGLALADTIGIALMMICFVVLANRRLGNTLNGLWRPLIKLGITASASGLVSGVLVKAVPGMSVWFKLPAAALAGCGIYLLTAWVLRVQELTVLFRLLTGREKRELTL